MSTLAHKDSTLHVSCVNYAPTTYTGSVLASAVPQPSPRGSTPNALYQLPMIAMNSNAYVPTVLPASTNTDNPPFPTSSSSTPSNTIAHAPAATTNAIPSLHTNLKCPACSKTLTMQKTPCLPGLQASLSYGKRARKTACS